MHYLVVKSIHVYLRIKQYWTTEKIVLWNNYLWTIYVYRYSDLFKHLLVRSLFINYLITYNTVNSRVYSESTKKKFFVIYFSKKIYFVKNKCFICSSDHIKTFINDDKHPYFLPILKVSVTKQRYLYKSFYYPVCSWHLVIISQTNHRARGVRSAELTW